jgi:hypothetical protein
LLNGKKGSWMQMGVYYIAYKADGPMQRYKAKLVAKGFTQTYGIGYEEIFAPVVKMNSI